MKEESMPPIPRPLPREPLRIGVIDTGINPWHSHVRGSVSGCRLYLDDDGRIREDDDFRDLVGHGTAVAGIIRRQVPYAELFVVRVFGQDFGSYPSLVARAVLRAAAHGCTILNLSLGMADGRGVRVLRDACESALDAGCTLVAAGRPDCPGILPASLPGVIGVVADDRLAEDEIRVDRGRSYPYAASGRPRDLANLPPSANLWGNSFACARITAHFAGHLNRVDSISL
jgi:subtilisin family serine protease